MSLWAFANEFDNDSPKIADIIPRMKGKLMKGRKGGDCGGGEQRGWTCTVRRASTCFATSHLSMAAARPFARPTSLSLHYLLMSLSSLSLSCKLCSRFHLFRHEAVKRIVYHVY